MLGKIKDIKEIHDFKIEPVVNQNGSGGKLGMMQMLNILCGYSNMDGYKIETENHTYYVLIDNGQSCCENWGYFSSEDDLSLFIGNDLIEVRLTDTALNQIVVDKSGYYEDAGGIQFVDFVTDKGVFQLAVYNAHNGYYGHGIIVAKDEEILLNDTL